MTGLVLYHNSDRNVLMLLPLTKKLFAFLIKYILGSSLFHVGNGMIYIIIY